MNEKEIIDRKLLKLRRFANFIITPLCVALICAYFIQKSVTPLVIILALLVVFTYLPYGCVVLYYAVKRRKLTKNNQ
ncbi:hypothetical protein BGL34_03775 [Fructilactobacillus lindneri]|uniref:hypothetical protein n=1 Tax=Fructilactobacillus lindneri TaxID=53444 RepID=UPI0006CFDA31|nr:hypothetical protein [Fructilactobacillus lindneri]POH03647.1 hypothetical protein BGL33_03225 [Fructilactobacillus lindneri]POH07006.1 hypothetical protein BGL34_03775 [Fructilactobacillus lindneri]SJZ86112.1 hypothetical protein SAMN02746042_00582 [Fructilactobacillus lindneri DSM 20690 = JCM 11027]